MSVVMALFLERSKQPSPADWAKAIRSSGFDLDLDTDFDADEFAGFLPCQYEGGEAGFEYSSEPVAKGELPEQVLAQLGGRDTMISFATHSDLRELATSMIASGVLCTLADGLLWEAEADGLVPASAALAWARAGVADAKAALGKARPRRG